MLQLFAVNYGIEHEHRQTNKMEGTWNNCVWHIEFKGTFIENMLFLFFKFFFIYTG